MPEQYGFSNAVYTTNDRTQTTSASSSESIWSRISAQITGDSPVPKRPDMSNKSDVEEAKSESKKPAQKTEQQKPQPKEEAGADNKEQCGSNSRPRFGARYAILTEEDMRGVGGFPWNSPGVQSAAYRPANGAATCGDTGRSTAPSARAASYRTITYK